MSIVAEKKELIIYEETHVKNIYEQIASHFNVTRVFTWSWIDEFINNLPKSSLIYDIGCGNGRNMQFSGYNFIGIDNCESFISICREKSMNVILGNMTDIFLPDNSADAIISIAAFHHLYTIENRILALQEMKRLIKPNGTIMISVWSMIQPLKTKVTFKNYGDNIVVWNKKYNRYYYIFKINEILDLFEISGLKLLEHKYDCGNEIFILKVK